MKKITLDFGLFSCDGELFDVPSAEILAKNLPRTISLEKWGNELYGAVGVELNDASGHCPKLATEIRPGGIAYSKRGNYICIFFGQNPAWEVEEIGRITGWQKLPDANSIIQVVIGLAE